MKIEELAPPRETGDVIHVFRSGSIQLLTDVSIDPAGDVWAANNWNLPKAAMASAPDPRFSTWGGGSGLTVIYGVAAPVKPPRMGLVIRYATVITGATGADPGVTILFGR